ncbi:uncharacterized protein C21orf58-like isoform X2 [Petromyzon marinus]|uniref:uncharacterized protein C21orf58-like isoform X2 n=1 Tax=Petromyzon marinus TaxID=7757 RepID=UPI003F6F1DE1
MHLVGGTPVGSWHYSDLGSTLKLREDMEVGNSMLDDMARLQLRFLEKRLEQEAQDEDDIPDDSSRPESPEPGAPVARRALHSALQRRSELLRDLREHEMLREMPRPRTWGGGSGYRRYRSLEPLEMPYSQFHPMEAHEHMGYHPPPQQQQQPQQQQILYHHTQESMPPEHQQPRIIHQTMPGPPATIIQQLPPQQPLIHHIPAALPAQAPPQQRGSIKEDMVEMMMFQNVQMHQIIMHNMMLNAFQPHGLGPPSTPTAAQEPAVPAMRFDKQRQSSVHHHHYPPPMLPPLPAMPPMPMWPAPPMAPLPPPPQPPPRPPSANLPPIIHHTMGATRNVAPTHTVVDARPSHHLHHQAPLGL